MIICYIGGIGSGKTISAVKEIVSSDNYAITNFRMKNFENYRRLKIADILISKDKKYVNVNWKYWEALRKRDFSIYLDEAHNIIHSRAAMTKRNILMSKWVSQIRKILSDSETNHLYIITQTPRKIDVNFRELTQIVITCEKRTFRKKVFIIQKYYNGFGAYDSGIKSGKGYFYANPYFKYYDTKEMVRFTDVDDFI